MELSIQWDYSEDRPSQPWAYKISFFELSKEGYAASLNDVWRIVDIFIASQVVHS